MEEVEVGDEIGHLLRSELRNTGLGLGHLGQDRGPLIPHAGSDLCQAFVKCLCLFTEVFPSLSPFTPDGMAFRAAL